MTMFRDAKADPALITAWVCGWAAANSASTEATPPLVALGAAAGKGAMHLQHEPHGIKARLLYRMPRIGLPVDIATTPALKPYWTVEFDVLSSYKVTSQRRRQQMRTLSPVNLAAAKYQEAAQEFDRGLRGVQAALNCNTTAAIAAMSSKSGITVQSLRQIRAGDRDPRRSADPISMAVEALGGPKLLFPSQKARLSGGVGTPPAPPVLPAPSSAITLPPGARGVRIDITFL